jgi:redox-sensitive bicupin YhaK (pirin superfamily)
VSIYASILKSGNEILHNLADVRHAWIQLISGSVEVNGKTLDAGDGAAISEETALKIKSREDKTEFLLFDLK